MQSRDPKKYDLEERTVKFSQKVLNFVKKLPKDMVSTPIISQFIRSATSIGANYCEANNTESRSDFKHKIGICKKESKETVYWLRMILSLYPDRKEEIDLMLNEAKEFTLIFGSIIKSTIANS
jgi:four helix bundle protein